MNGITVDKLIFMLRQLDPHEMVAAVITPEYDKTTDTIRIITKGKGDGNSVCR